jgi:hypothetical protein
MCWPHVNPVPSGAVGKDFQRRLFSRPRFVRACSATDLFNFIYLIGILSLLHVILKYNNMACINLGANLTFYAIVILGGLVVIVLAIGPKVRRLKPGRGRWILRAIKLWSTTSFGGEVKPSVQCCKILRYVKFSGGWQRYFSDKINGRFSPSFSVLPFLVSLLVFATVVVDESGMIRTQMGTLSR